MDPRSEPYDRFSLGSVGGAAGILARDSIPKVEVPEHPGLSMEAVWRIEVENLRCSIIVDDMGDGFVTREVEQDRARASGRGVAVASGWGRLRRCLTIPVPGTGPMRG